MRVRRALGLVVVLAAATATMSSPVGAAWPVQVCSGPPPISQAGSATLDTGLNGLPTKQIIKLALHLTSCSRAKPTDGSGKLKFTYTTPTAQTCALVNQPHVLNVKAIIIWKNLRTSSLALKLSFTGGSDLLNISGSVTDGVFATHLLTGQYRYKRVVSPHGKTVAQACADKAVPGFGQIKIGELTFTQTKSFTII